MSYTNQKVSWEHRTSQDIYGDISHNTAVSIIARKQPHQEVIKTSDGRELLSKSIYYVEVKVEPNALSIARLDKLDGEIVESIYVMCDLGNTPKLVKLVTV